MQKHAEEGSEIGEAFSHRSLSLSMKDCFVMRSADFPMGDSRLTLQMAVAMDILASHSVYIQLLSQHPVIAIVNKKATASVVVCK